MATQASSRVTTFSGKQLYDAYDPSVILAQKVQRLRINRIAIVQTLKVEHVLPRLLQRRVIDEQDKRTIISGRTTQDKTRLLLDILPDKGRAVDWFGEFRDALKNPDTSSPEVKKKYQMLLDFMDNTLIQPPPVKSPPPKPPISPIDAQYSSKSFPRYNKLPSISDKKSSVKLPGSEFEGSSANGMFEEKSCQDEENEKKPAGVRQYTIKELPMPESYQPLIHEPKEVFDPLKQSALPDDRDLLKAEKAVLAQMQEVEQLIALEQRAQVPHDFVLCFSEPVQTMLSSPHTHLYFKYLYYLSSTYNIDILREISYALTSFLDEQDDCADETLRQLVVQTGFGLFEFLSDYGKYPTAEMVILSVMRYLSTQTALENWMNIWRGLIKMMNISNANIRFQDTNSAYHFAVAIGHKIKLMSFGKDLLDESSIYVELSTLLREQGSISPAFQWAQRAIKEVEETNHRGVVDVLCNAVLAYCMQWKVKQAEDLAIKAVRFAKHHFGVRHPMYVKALLHFVYYSNEFRQDNMGVDVAKEALEIAEKIYGGAPSIMVAYAHEALAKAIVASTKMENEDYVEHALKAWRMAIDVLPGNHPKLAQFRYTNAQVLQWKAVQVETSKTEGYLIWAQTEGQTALNMFKSCWGEYSIKFVQAYSLMGQIYAKLNQPDKAEEYLQGSIDTLRLCIPANSNYHAIAKASLGLFYRTVDRPLGAIRCLKESLDCVGFSGIYLRWVQMCYDSVITLCKAVGQTQDAEHYQISLVDYLKKNPHFSDPVSWEELYEEPPSLDGVKENVFQLQTKIQKNKNLLLAASNSHPETGEVDEAAGEGFDLMDSWKT